MRGVLIILCGILLTAGPALATPYYIAYEGDTPGVFPEDVGWERLATGGGANRTIADGVMRLSADITGISESFESHVKGPFYSTEFIVSFAAAIQAYSNVGKPCVGKFISFFRSNECPV